jgi:hypothetical protein
MSRHQRFFTVEEANAIVPKLVTIIEDIKTLKMEIASEIPELESALSKARINGGHNNGENYVARLTKFYHYLSSIAEIGCVLKDIDLGLIDFPSILGGREVYLCWKLGEDRVRFWHELDTGFSDRKPL